VFSLAGVVSSVANGLALPQILIQVIVSTLGSVFLVATFGSGGGEHRARDLLRLGQAFALGTMILSLSCFLGPKSNEGRSIGWAIHPNALGHSCVIGVFVCTWLWDNARTTRGRLLWAFGAVLNVGAIMESGSRGALLGLGIGGLIYLALRGNFRLKLAAIGMAWFFVLVLVTGVVQLPAGNPIQRLVVGGANTEGSNEARRQLLAEDLENIAEDPIFGKSYDDIINVHVVYFQAWIGGGAVDGFILMLIGTTMLIMPLWHRPRDLALACGASAIAVAWLFTNIMTARDQWIFIALAFATARPLSILRAGGLEGNRAD
jgi:O-antigen ligase